MNIEIIGIGSPNKGAELMLSAIMTKIKEQYSDVKFVLNPNIDYKYRSRFGCYQKSWFTFKGVQIGHFFRFIPKRFRYPLGILLDAEIDIILDASGFAYGDQWGAFKAKHRMGKHILKWKKQGKKIVLLPQAFGSFEDIDLRKEMEIIFENCNLVFARDKKSYDFASSIGSGKIYQSPDFTNLCQGVLPRDLESEKLDICVIPNAKMIEMTSKEIGGNYIVSLVDAIQLVIEKGRKPFLLVHEGEKDLNIAKEINKLLKNKLPIYKYDDPIEIKGIIGHSNLVISSRFHGLVSSLSQGVPCVATGWSHKYQMLMNDYECGKYLANEKSSVKSLISLLLDIDEYTMIKKKIIKNSQIQKKLTLKMWDQVFKII